jgi:hypothetical protein
MVVAQVVSIDGRNTRKNNRNPRIVFIADDKEYTPLHINKRQESLRWTFKHAKVYTSQGNEVLVIPEGRRPVWDASKRELVEEIDVCGWFQDYCGEREGPNALSTIKWKKPVELVWDGHCFREPGSKRKAEELFLFGSSYGGNGIKFPISVKLGKKSIFYKEGEG